MRTKQFVTILGYCITCAVLVFITTRVSIRYTDLKMAIHEGKERLSTEDLSMMAGIFYWQRTIGPDMIKKYRSAEVGIYSKRQGSTPLFSRPIDYVDDTSRCRILVSVQRIGPGNIKLFLMCQTASGRECIGDTTIESPFAGDTLRYLPQYKFWTDDTISGIALCGSSSGRITKLLADPNNRVVVYLKFLGTDGSARTPETQQHFFTHLGDSLPQIRWFTLAGSPQVFDPKSSRVNLLTFARTTCCPCVAELEKIRTRLFPKYQKMGLSVSVILTKDRDDAMESLSRFAESYGRGLSVYYDTSGMNSGSLVPQMFYPLTYIVDSSGRILYQRIGFAEKEFPEMKKIVSENISH